MSAYVISFNEEEEKRIELKSKEEKETDKS
jgi:hypothetical protein